MRTPVRHMSKAMSRQFFVLHTISTTAAIHGLSSAFTESSHRHKSEALSSVSAESSHKHNLRILSNRPSQDLHIWICQGLSHNLHKAYPRGALARSTARERTCVLRCADLWRNCGGGVLRDNFFLDIVERMCHP